MIVKTNRVLGQLEHKFTTEVVFQAGTAFFYEERNGGQRGAHSVGGPSDGPQQLTRDQALARLASWGIEEVDIEEKE